MEKDEVMVIAVGIFLAIVVCVLAGMTLANTTPGSSGVPEPEPNIYNTRTDRMRTFEGGEVWILEYTVNGVFQAPVFDSPEALAEYREYLDTIGRVYRKEDTNGQE
jgi:hypothetical protein